jgi:hypothetical protein
MDANAKSVAQHAMNSMIWTAANAKGAAKHITIWSAVNVKIVERHITISTATVFAKNAELIAISENTSATLKFLMSGRLIGVNG